jgi:hypothetical protein
VGWQTDRRTDRPGNEERTTMGIRTAGLRGIAMVALLLGFAAGCSSSDDASSDPNATVASTTTTAAVTALTTAPRQSCAADTLTAAAAASFEAPKIIDVVCETEFATATLENGPSGETVVLFNLQGGVWVLAGSGAVADAVAATPAGFSPTAVPTWQRLRDARLKREANPDAGRGDPSPYPSSTQVNDGVVEICTQYGADFVECVTSTLPNIVEEPPADPDAPPTTQKQSGFCKYNYNDTRCINDPGFEPG